MNSNQQPKVKAQLPCNSRIVQNFILVWLDLRIDFSSSITELQRIVNTINTFTDADQCIDFVTNIKDEKILMIISDEFVENVVPLVHDITQINSIYIFCKNKLQNNQWMEQWSKVKVIFTAISEICQALTQDARTCDQDSLSISFVSLSSENSIQNLNQLDPSFMYTQIFKEILLTIDFDEQHIKDLTNYYRDNFSINDIQLSNIEQFQRDYDKHTPIWWYTHECWFYSVLNRALRMMEVDTIIKMGFFIRDLHQQIVQLHSEQLSEDHHLEPFILYRGQGLSTADFDKMRRTQGGLISFNNFLSTSKDLTVALGFARGSLANPASVGIVFVMTIDPSIKSTPFASINNVSYYKTEEEILFSMHTVFRIDNIMQIESDHRLWHIDLVQTNDNDPQLNNLTQRIRDEIRGKNKWDQMGKLLIKLGQFNKADELYEVLVDQTDNDHEKTHFYHQLGWSKKKQKQYNDAIIFYEKALEIKRSILPSNHHSFAISYNDIGSVFEQINQYPKALLYYEQGLEIEQNISSSNQSGLGCSYNNIGCIYAKMGEYSKALLFHENAVEIRENLPPSDHGTLAQSYNNIGSVHAKIGNYAEALSSHEKALEIQKTILPPNHPDLAQSHSDIGFVYGKMGKHSKARENHQYAVDIAQRSLPGNHPRLQLWRKNLEYAKRKCH